MLGTALLVVLQGLGAASSLSIPIPSIAFKTAGVHVRVEPAASAGLKIGSSWAESTIYVPATDAFSRSRPALFGRHVTDPAGQTVTLTPIDAFDPSATGTNLGCTGADDEEDDAPSILELESRPPTNWAALVKRGGCSFAHKARRALALGAVAIVVGDHQSPYDDDPLGSPPLIQMWAKDADALDSLTARFVSHPTYKDLMTLAESGPVPVVLGLEESYSWALSDLLVGLLFLPSLLSIATVIVHRIQLARQRRRERAPQDAIDALPWVVWQEEGLGADVPVKDADNEVESSQPWYRRALDRVRRAQAAPNPDVAPPPAGKPIAFSTLASRNLFTQRECAICLSSFAAGDAVRVLPCGHLFHCSEVDVWLFKTKRCCPQCRASITSPSPSAALLSAALSSPSTPTGAAPTEETPLLSRDV